MSTPSIRKPEQPEYVNDVEGVLEKLTDPLRVVYNVDPSEARSNLVVWKDALVKEMEVVSQGFRRISAEDFREEGYEKSQAVTYVPSKVVCTIKSPDQGTQALFKRKARIVAWGNYSKDEGLELYPSGASGETLRCILAEAAHRSGSAGCVHVDTNAGVYCDRGQPAYDSSLFGLVERGEKWILTRAMYGLRQSPRLWSGFRDQHLREMVGNWEGEEVKFAQGEVEPNLWSVMVAGSICGALLVYVDDLLICGSSGLIEYVAKMIAQLWETTQLEVATSSEAERFLGCEIHDLEPGFSIDQTPYIRELLQAHGTSATQLNVVPCPREWLGLDEDLAAQDRAEDDIRQAQRITGELLWVTQRSRPDLAYHVPIMASLTSKDPKRVVKIGKRVLGFLQRTAETRLELRPQGEGMTPIRTPRVPLLVLEVTLGA